MCLDTMATIKTSAPKTTVNLRKAMKFVPRLRRFCVRSEDGASMLCRRATTTSPMKYRETTTMKVMKYRETSTKKATVGKYREATTTMNATVRKCRERTRLARLIPNQDNADIENMSSMYSVNNKDCCTRRPPGTMAPHNTTQYLMEQAYEDMAIDVTTTRYPMEHLYNEDTSPGVYVELDSERSLAFQQRDFEEVFARYAS